jgi:hypothetical protein
MGNETKETRYADLCHALWWVPHPRRTGFCARALELGQFASWLPGRSSDRSLLGSWLVVFVSGHHPLTEIMMLGPLSLKSRQFPGGFRVLDSGRSLLEFGHHLVKALLDLLQVLAWCLDAHKRPWTAAARIREHAGTAWRRGLGVADHQGDPSVNQVWSPEVLHKCWDFRNGNLERETQQDNFMGHDGYLLLI